MSRPRVPSEKGSAKVSISQGSKLLRLAEEAICDIWGIGWLYKFLQRESLVIKAAWVLCLVLAVVFFSLGAWAGVSWPKKRFTGLIFRTVWAVERQHKVIAVAIQMKVINDGTQSIAEGFYLTLKSGSKTWKHIPWQHWPFSPATTFTTSDGKRTINIKESDMLYKRLVEPVVGGGKAVGWLVYVFEGMPDVPDKYDIDIEFSDVSGNQFYIHRSSKEEDKSGNSLYVPDVDNPFEGVNSP